MTVLEVVRAAATELGIADEVNEYLEGISENAKADAENLLRCFNLVEGELALDHLPLTAEDELETQTGAIYYSELSRAAVRVIKVADARGNELAFRVFPEYLKTQSGRVCVTYAYTPEEKGFTDESDYGASTGARLFAYGVAAEFCLAAGRFEEAAVWDAKYKEAIGRAYRMRPAKRIRSRRWV